VSHPQSGAGNAALEILVPRARADPANATDILFGVGVNDFKRLNMQPDCRTRHRWNRVEFTRMD